MSLVYAARRLWVDGARYAISGSKLAQDEDRGEIQQFRQGYEWALANRPPSVHLPKQIARLRQQMKSFVAGLAKEVANKENPGITRISEKAFTVPSSQMGTNWSPFYHDWRLQGVYVGNLFKGMIDAPATATEKLRSILERGNLDERNGTLTQRIKFHPGFIEANKKLIADAVALGAAMSNQPSPSSRGPKP